LSILATGGIALVAATDPTLFQPYFGGLHPAFGALLICVAGIATFRLLRKRWGLQFFIAKLPPRARLVPVLAALPFMVAVTLADLLLGFPLGIHVPLPTALAFYPTMGYIAQIALHILPFALLMVLGEFLFESWSEKTRLRLAIVLAAGIEAALQVTATAEPTSPLAFFTAAQLFFFGTTELLLYCRYDYLAMYTFRITYYGYWHILWSALS